jgi:hypothetical protein
MLVRTKVTQKILDYYEANPNSANAKKQAFIEALRDKGIVRRAIDASGIDRTIAYIWRETDPEFRQAWLQALEDSTDEVEESLYDMAVSRKNVVATIFHLKGNRRNKYNDRITVDTDLLQRQVEERLERYRQQLSLPPASTKDIINSVLGFTGGDTSQPVAAPTTNDNHHD